KKLAKYDANDLDGDAQRLYIALSDALQTARSNNEYQPDPAHLVLADPATVPDVETAVMLRDRVLNGWFYAELSQAEKDAYDYYNEIVKERIRQRDELEKVTEHRLRPIPTDTVVLPMDLLKQTYEPQAGGSNDCWSCAAAGILNQYLHKEAANKYTAQGIRNYNPAFLDKMPDGMEPDAFEKAKADISKYTTANRNANRVGSPQGNPFEIADFYMQEFARTPGMQNTCVRHKSFLVSSAYKRAQGLEGPDKKDSAAYQNMKAEFVTSIVEALRKGSAVAMLVSGHYTTIVGITQGSVLKVHNSYPPKDPTQVVDKNLDEIFIGSENQSAIELTWFDQVTPELTGQFSDLAYDEQTKTYSSKSKITSENVAQKNGVIARKTPVELPEDMRGLIQEDVYVPRQIANNQA
ncbi:MAG: hypothetical protein IJT32_01300, partial [Lachnospiraceae bacterium]|nr:hypothetical protein [Lachnospiraceae bacterium]